MFQTFSGSQVNPAKVSLSAIALSATALQLAWPTTTQSGTNIVAGIMEVTPSGSGQACAMPDATQSGAGQDVLFRNLGSQTFTVTDIGGNTICTVASGASVYLYLQSNATANGAWQVVAFGASTATANAATLAGYGLKAISATLNQSHTVVTYTTNVTVDSTYRAQVLAWTSGSNTCTLPSSGSVGADFFVILKNAGGGTITVTPNGGDLIDGAASLSLSPGDACMLCSNGSGNSWFTVGLGRAVAFAFTQLILSVAGNTDVTLTSSQAANVLMSFTGALTGNINVIVPNTASVYYVYNNTSGAYTLSFKTAAGAAVAVAQGTRDILTCDATNVQRAVTNTVASTVFAVGSAGAPSITWVGDTSTGFYHPAAGQTAFTSASTQTVLFTATGLTVYVSGAASDLTIGGNATSTVPTLTMRAASATRYNFQVGINSQTNDTFTITPSTAIGGTTFTTPVFSAKYDGSISFGAAGSANVFLGATTMGDGTVGTSQALIINGGSNSSRGARIQFQRAGVTGFTIGNDSAVVGGANSDAAIQAGAGLGFNVYTNGGTTAPFTVSSTGNVNAATGVLYTGSAVITAPAVAGDVVIASSNNYRVSYSGNPYQVIGMSGGKVAIDNGGVGAVFGGTALVSGYAESGTGFSGIQSTGSMANNGTYNMVLPGSGPGSILCFLREQTGGNWALVALSVDLATATLIAQSGAIFTITSGNGGTINVYVTGGTPTIQNKAGGPRVVKMALINASA